MGKHASICRPGGAPWEVDVQASLAVLRLGRMGLTRELQVTLATFCKPEIISSGSMKSQGLGCSAAVEHV